MQQRRHFQQARSLEERLAEEADRLRQQAELLRPGAVRDATLRRARQAETGSHMSEWLRSPGLQPPK
jgi:hypothetical protein